jgi:ribose 5-phosphate isomerase B
MKISIGTDHGGIALREYLANHLEGAGHTVTDHGTFTADSVDYPDYAHLVTADLRSGRSEFGLLICTSGIGMCIAANKMPGIRAAVIHFPDDAAKCREHNNVNVICLGAKHETPESAARLVDIFLATKFEGGRHARRVDKFECGATSCGS